MKYEAIFELFVSKLDPMNFIRQFYLLKDDIGKYEIKSLDSHNRHFWYLEIKTEKPIPEKYLKNIRNAGIKIRKIK